MYSKIIGTGSYLPAKVLTNFDLEKIVDTSHDWIVSRSGIVERHIAADNEMTSDLALQASLKAIEAAGIGSDQIDLVVVATTTPDQVFPSTACILQDKLGIRNNCAAFDMQAVCGGFVYAMNTADLYIRSGQAKTALVVGADNHSTPLVDRWRMFAGTVMGDGGCALLVTTDGGFAEVLAVNLTTVCEAEPVSDGGVPMFPPEATVGRPLDFVARNREFRERLLAQGGTSALLGIQKKLMEMVDQTLAEAGITLTDVTRVAFPHGRRDELCRGALSWLGLEMADTTWEFGASIGHLGVSDQFVALDHLLATGALAAGDYVLLIGLGAGITMSCAALRIIDIPQEYAC